MTPEQFNEMISVLERIADNTEKTLDCIESIKREMPSSASTVRDLDDLYEKLGDVEAAILNQ
jgi:hypothetical protein